MEVNTFDIVKVDFGNVVFAGEQGGVRPAVVIQNAYGNIYSGTTIVIPFTTKIKHVQQPTHSFFYNVTARKPTTFRWWVVHNTYSSIKSQVCFTQNS